jgi:hypothetical protein
MRSSTTPYKKKRVVVAARLCSTWQLVLPVRSAFSARFLSTWHPRTTSSLSRRKVRSTNARHRALGACSLAESAHLSAAESLRSELMSLDHTVDVVMTHPNVILTLNLYQVRQGRPAQPHARHASSLATQYDNHSVHVKELSYGSYPSHETVCEDVANAEL